MLTEPECRIVELAEDNAAQEQPVSRTCGACGKNHLHLPELRVLVPVFLHDIQEAAQGVTFLAQIRKGSAGKIEIGMGKLETLIFTRPKAGYMLNVDKENVLILPQSWQNT